MLKELAGYAAYMFAATSVIRLLTFGVSMLGAKLRSKDTFGEYSTYVLIYSLGQNLLIAGVNQTIQKYAAADDQNLARFTQLAYRVFLVLLAVTGIAGIGMGLLWKWPMSLSMFGVPWAVVWFWGRYLLRSRLNARKEALLMVIGSLTNSGLQLTFLLLGFENALIYGDFGSLFISGLITLIVLPRWTGLTVAQVRAIDLPKPLLKETFTFTLPLWWTGQIYAASQNICGLFTRDLLGAAALGAFGLMQQLWQFAQTPMELVSQGALPGLVGAKTDRGQLFRELVRLCLIAFPFIGIAVAAGLPLLLQLMGLAEKWAEVPLLLQILALEVPFRAFQIVANQYCVAEGRPKVSLYAHAAHAVVTAGVLYPAAIMLGVRGVVIAEDLGMATNAIVFAVAMWRDYRAEMRTGLIQTFLTALATTIALTPVYLYREWAWNWVIAFPAVGLYLLLLFMFRVARPLDIERGFRMLKEKFGARFKKKVAAT